MHEETAIPKGRRKLAAVVRAAGDIVHIADAERVLDISRSDAAKLLSRWSGQGWLRRVGPGAYAPVDLTSLGSQQVLDDPWVLVPALYDPAYIGGRTAAEHWDLTEQIFRDIVVVTGRPVRARTQVKRAIFHDYSDAPAEGIAVLCYASARTGSEYTATRARLMTRSCSTWKSSLHGARSRHSLM